MPTSALPRAIEVYLVIADREFTVRLQVVILIKSPTNLHDIRPHLTWKCLAAYLIGANTHGGQRRGVVAQGRSREGARAKPALQAPGPSPHFGASAPSLIQPLWRPEVAEQAERSTPVPV